MLTDNNVALMLASPQLTTQHTNNNIYINDDDDTDNTNVTVDNAIIRARNHCRLHRIHLINVAVMVFHYRHSLLLPTIRIRIITQHGQKLQADTKFIPQKMKITRYLYLAHAPRLPRLHFQ